MDTTTIRVTRKTRDELFELAQASGTTMQEVLAQAIEAYRGQRLLEAVNAAYATLKENRVAWDEYRDELAEWDTTLPDGLTGT